MHNLDRWKLVKVHKEHIYKACWPAPLKKDREFHQDTQVCLQKPGRYTHEVRGHLQVNFCVWKGNTSFMISSKPSLWSHYRYKPPWNHRNDGGLFHLVSCRKLQCSAVYLWFNCHIIQGTQMWWEKQSPLPMCVLQTAKYGMENGFVNQCELINMGQRVAKVGWTTGRPGVELKWPWARLVSVTFVLHRDKNTSLQSPTVAASVSELAQPSRVNSKGTGCCQSLRHGGGNENSRGEAAPSSPGFTATGSQATVQLFHPI